MSVEANKLAFRGIPEQIINKNDLSNVLKYLTEDFVEHAPLPPGWPTGIAALQQWVTVMRNAFPDFIATVHNVIGEGDYVAGHLTVHGTHLGEFMGVPATGRAVSWTEQHFGRMENGRCAEHWGLADIASLMTQITAPQEGVKSTSSETASA